MAERTTMFKTVTCSIALVTIMSLSIIPAFAGKADVLAAKAIKIGDSWQISATIKHADEGWKHYANSFQVLSMDGTVLGTRVLFHPHVDEQPFTRSLRGVNIPANTTKIRVRAGDLVHGYGGKETVIKLSK